MTAVTSREVIHNFSAVAARIAAGEELTVTRYGKPALKLVRIDASGISSRDRKALVRKALSYRMTWPYGKHFERSDAYDSCVSLGAGNQHPGLRHRNRCTREEATHRAALAGAAFFEPAGLHGRSGSERVAERSVAQKSDGPRLGA